MAERGEFEAVLSLVEVLPYAQRLIALATAVSEHNPVYVARRNKTDSPIPTKVLLLIKAGCACLESTPFALSEPCAKGQDPAWNASVKAESSVFLKRCLSNSEKWRARMLGNRVQESTVYSHIDITRPQRSVQRRAHEIVDF
jgi:hypothetical protein